MREAHTLLHVREAYKTTLLLF